MTDPTPTSRRFALVRDVDHTGVSGTGLVAEGVQFQDETVALRWHGEHASTVVWSSLEHAMAVHGHDGATTVHWFDDENGKPVDSVTQRFDAMTEAAAALAGAADAEGARPTLRAAEVIQLATWLQHGAENYAAAPQRRLLGTTTTALELQAETKRYQRPF